MNIEELREEISTSVSEFELPDIKEDWEERLSALGWKVKIYYDCGYSQGSGACFEIESVDFNAVVRSARKYLCKDSRKALRKIKRYSADVTITIKHGGHYYHENSATVGLSVCNRSNAKINVEILEQALEEWRRDLCIEIYQSLCNAIEYYWDDEKVLEYAANMGIKITE